MRRERSNLKMIVMVKSSWRQVKLQVNHNHHLLKKMMILELTEKKVMSNLMRID